MYFREGDPKVRVAPDVFVVVGASSHERNSYLLWQEPKAPDWVLEITSRSTRAEDQGPKRELYRWLGVAEYWQYDPTGDYLSPPLQGLELVAGEYEQMPSGERGDGTQAMASAVLGLELRVSERGLRFHDPETDRDLPTYAEISAAQRQAEANRRQAEAEWRQAEAEWRQAEAEWRQAEAERQQERTALQQAETRIAELEALLRERDAGNP